MVVDLILLSKVAAVEDPEGVFLERGEGAASKRLERSGLITRNPQNRNQIRITDKGLRALEMSSRFLWQVTQGKADAPLWDCTIIIRDPRRKRRR